MVARTPEPEGVMGRYKITPSGIAALLADNGRTDFDVACAIFDFVFAAVLLNMLLWQLSGGWSWMVLLGSTSLALVALRLSLNPKYERTLWMLILAAVFLNALLGRFGRELGGGPAPYLGQTEGLIPPTDSGPGQVAAIDQVFQGQKAIRELLRSRLEGYFPRLDEEPGVASANNDFRGRESGDQDASLGGGQRAEAPSPGSPGPDRQRLAETGNPPEEVLNNPSHPSRAPPSQ